ncbi:MAG: DUF1631 family protein [Hydrogenophilales bacterium]|nr:DUF1631 family protein [Hydrogenophilales bacterium]
MNIQPVQPSPAALLREADARMAQALDNFFQRSRVSIQDTIFRALAMQMTTSAIATGQTCLDWLNAYPEALSTAFADQFRRHLAQPETFPRRLVDHPSELQLVDDETLKRQLAEEKAAAYMTEILRAEMMLLFGRMGAVQRAAQENTERNHADLYSPLAVVRALSRALDALGIDPACGTFLLQNVHAPLLDTLKHTYTALNQFLGTADIPDLPATRAASPSPPRRSDHDAGLDVLAHIRSAATPSGGYGPATGAASAGLFHAATPRSLFDSLADWHALPAGIPDSRTGTPALVLRQLQQDARHADAGAFDLAILDAVAGLFECILDDPGVSPRYKAEIAHLQIPALRVALVAPDFFSDDQHPARRLIDLMGLFSRRFPEGNATHLGALAQIQAACTTILRDADHPAEAFAQAYDALSAWLAGENARAEAALTAEVANLEHIERQELGTLLALENLHDLTERYPAPESVLRRLEAAWVPYMASLYVAESGEGPDWRAACLTLQNLFLSLQAPDSDATRENRLLSIPAINTALRRGLLAQGAEPAQLKDFFSAITATQECWIRPAVGQREAMVSSFTPLRVSQAQIESLARQLPDTQEADPALQQSQQLIEGDWVDFDPPYEGLATARVAWVGVRGYLLFCDSEGEQRFSLDREHLADEIRAGRARIPEQSLTRNAMLRLKTRLTGDPA